MAGSEEQYVRVPAALLEAMHELFQTSGVEGHELESLRLVLRAAGVDPVSGAVVVGVRVVRDLDPT